MARVKRSVTARKRRKRVLKAAKGYSGTRSKLHRVAREAVEKAAVYAYRGRKERKRQFRALWIARINAAAREHGRVVQVGMQRRSTPHLIEARDEIPVLRRRAAVADP